MSVDKENLKALAEAATPGEWQAYDTHGKRFIENMIGEAHIVCYTPKKQWLKDSEYIAAANPVAILSLLAEVDALRKDAERYRFIRDSSRCDELLDLEDIGRYAMEALDGVVDDAMNKEK